MGNREDLLAGAKRCLYEKGYGRTTARDIAASSGVSLAAIGYHFGSKDALLSLALIEATGEWGEALAAAVAGAGEAGQDPQERFAAVWDDVLKTFSEHRGLWAAQFEAISQVEHLPDLKESLGAAQRTARLGLSALFQGVEEVPDTEEELARGSFYQSLLAGLAAQWLAAPDQAPAGGDILQGLRLLAGDVLTGEQARVPR
ncbi:TetR/AcrR family transcriptional regulator [Kitasatospora sp. NPDC050543]|uniref:TetR/AcrR family transcriptional regulator n=1 Tax=Kitasatospora sp. NPDC050543 TaxID=3364054 RepID=UPI00378CB76C